MVKGFMRVQVFCDVAVDVLCNDDAGVDHHSDADRQTAQGEEVGGDPGAPHQHKGDQHTARHREGRYGGGSEVAQQKKKNKDDEDFTGDKGIADRGHTVDDQDGLVVEGHDGDVGGQRSLKFRNPLLYTGDHVRRVGPEPQNRDTRNDLPFAILRHRPLANFRPKLNVGDVFDIDRHAVFRRDHDIADIFRRLDEADAAHDVLKPAVLYKIPPAVLVVLADGVG